MGKLLLPAVSKTDIEEMSHRVLGNASKHSLGSMKAHLFPPCCHFVQGECGLHFESAIKHWSCVGPPKHNFLLSEKGPILCRFGSLARGKLKSTVLTKTSDELSTT